MINFVTITMSTLLFAKHAKHIIYQTKNTVVIKSKSDIKVSSGMMEKMVLDIPKDRDLSVDDQLDSFESPKEEIHKEENIVPENELKKTVDPTEDCKYFLKREDFTTQFVDEIISKAADVVTRDYGEVTVDTEITDVPNIPWPSINDFNTELGIEKLNDYINSTMISTENWVFSVQFLNEYSDLVSHFYKYEAKFSIPTSCYPIPQATASIFFLFEVSKVKPKNCEVTVSFQLEGFSLTMYPGKDLITDALLFRVVDAKLAVFRKITF